MRIGERAVALGLTVALLAACSSPSKSGQATKTHGAAGSSEAGTTITVGVLTDLTGPGSNIERFTPDGIKAGVALAAREGDHVKYVMADGGTSPTQLLTAAKHLVQQDHVFAVIGLSSVLFAAAPWLQSQGVPVVGADYDGLEWLETPSMFSVFPYQDPTKVSTTVGAITKILGGTSFASIGYSTLPTSANTAKSYGVSAQDAGLKTGYINPDLPFGTTNVGPLVLAMKSAGIDSLFPATDPDTSLALFVGLRQQGVDLKVPFLAEEEGDLLAGGPASVTQSKGVYTVGLYQPPQMNTAATKEIASYLQSAAGVTTPPTIIEYMAYLSTDALVTGLKKAGPHATRASFINAMESITDYTGRGLLGSPISFAPVGRGDTTPCNFITQWNGTSFQLVPKLDPYCGTLTGQKV